MNHLTAAKYSAMADTVSGLDAFILEMQRKSEVILLYDENTHTALLQENLSLHFWRRSVIWKPNQLSSKKLSTNWMHIQSD
jgi:hypothetical protein